MSCLRFRVLSLAIGVVLFFGLFSGSGSAAGCHTDCSLTFPTMPNPCLTCGFRALSNVLCFRRDCDTCDTVDCGLLLPAMVDQWASGVARSEGCAATSAPTSTVRVLKVQRLAARS